MPPTTIAPQTLDGTVTSWLPLTTTFTPPAGCSNSFQLSGSTGPGLVAFDPRYGISVDTNVQCQPSVATKSFLTPQFLSGDPSVLVQLSIMPMTCPLGWTTLASSVSDGTSTLAMCCPPGYYLASSTPGFVVGNCASNVKSGATLSYASTTNDGAISWVVESLDVKEATTVQAVPLIGWNVGTPSTSTPSSSAPSSSTPAPSSTSSPASNKASSGGLSPGAEAGIGVGAAVVGITLAALLLIYILRKRKTGKHKVPSGAVRLPPDTAKDGPHVLTHEIEGRNRGHELQAQSTGHEMDALRVGEMAGEPRLPPYSAPPELP